MLSSSKSLINRIFQLSDDSGVGVALLCIIFCIYLLVSMKLLYNCPIVKKRISFVAIKSLRMNDLRSPRAKLYHVAGQSSSNIYMVSCYSKKKPQESSAWFVKGAPFPRDVLFWRAREAEEFFLRTFASPWWLLVFSPRKLSVDDKEHKSTL